MKKNLIKEEEGITVTINYILVFALCTLFFMSFIYAYNTIFTVRSTKIVMEQQFNDIGNQFGTAIIDMAMLINKPGTSVSTEVNIPYKIGGHVYFVEMGDAGGDTEITVCSSDLDVSFNYTLSGMSGEFNITGMVYSTQSEPRCNVSK
ncbi:MAG: hypothetical protein ACXQS7_04355 [Candidatus Syntropharchaeia archaeon]